MRYRRTLFVILTLTFATAVRSEAQFYQELGYPLSADANAMGGAGAALVSDDPLATALNPAQLGFSSFSGGLHVGVVPSLASPNYYSPLYGGFWNLTGLSRAVAIDFGFPLNRVWNQLPSDISIGVGYVNARYAFDYFGSYPVQPTRGDYVNGISIGVGLKYLVKLGIGYAINPVSLTINPWPSPNGSVTASATAQSIGAILEIPLLDLMSEANRSPVLTSAGLRPVFNLTFGFSARNLGSHSYLGGAGLPEEADLAWNIRLGLETRVGNHEWKWIAFNMIREADASLLSLDSTLTVNPSNTPDSVYNYYYGTRNGIGGFHIYDNLIAGKPTALDHATINRPVGDIGVLKGAQIELGQFIYLREGSVTEAGLPTYTTYGWGAKLDGLVKTLLFMHCISPGNEIAKLLLDHFNLDFAYSKANGGPFHGEPFESLNLVVR